MMMMSLELKLNKINENAVEIITKKKERFTVVLFYRFNQTERWYRKKSKNK